jgi:hypothetical protein
MMNGLIAVKHYRHPIKMFRHLSISQFAPCYVAEIMLPKLVRTSGVDARHNVEDWQSYRGSSRWFVHLRHQTYWPTNLRWSEALQDAMSEWAGLFTFEGFTCVKMMRV